MRKIYSTIILLCLFVSAQAETYVIRRTTTRQINNIAPRSILHFSGIYDYYFPKHEWAENNLGFNISAGIETANRYNTIMANFDYLVVRGDWGLGLSYYINPLGITANNYPLNLSFLVGLGYRNIYNQNNMYGDIGVKLEIGQGYVRLFIQDRLGANYSFPNNKFNFYNRIEFGLKFIIGSYI